MTGEAPPPGWWTRNQLIGAAGASVVQAGVIHGDVVFAPHSVAPAQLPAPARWFTNRRRELAGLAHLLEPVTEPAAPPRLVVIRGRGGSGKTVLALQWAHTVRETFEGGQFFIDLRGFSDDRSGPIPPGGALAGFLRALGIHPDFIPAQVAEQAALWRSAIAGRRVLIVADNASSAKQVRPLLPGSAPAVVVVTTRLPPAELAVDGAYEVHLDLLDVASSIDLLQQIAGPDRLHADPDAVRALVARSGHLPLTLRTLGAYLRNHPDRPAQVLVDELNHQRTRRTEDEVDNHTTTALDATYQQRPVGEQEIYRMVGDLPVVDVAAATIAERAGITPEEALQRLRGLADAGLIERSSEGRFRLHDRIRPHARATAAAAVTPQVLRGQRQRVATWYRDFAADAQRAIIPNRWYLGEVFTRPIRVEFTRDGALDWLDAEKDNLLAVQQMAADLGMYVIACDITEAGWGLFLRRRHLTWWRRCCETGLSAASVAGDGVRMARMHEGLGSVHQYLHEWIRAEEHYRTALDLEEENDHLLGAASAFEGIGICQRQLGHPKRALAYFLRSLGYHLALKRWRGARLQWRHIAEAYHVLGRYDEAIEAIGEARALPFPPGEEYLISRELLVEGNTYRDKGDLDRAEDILTRHRDLVRQIRADLEEGNSELALADLANARGNRDQELQHLNAACLIYKRLGSPQAGELKTRLRRLQPEDRNG